jgi:hypothetical protein
MKKQIVTFLRFLEVEANIEIDYSNFLAPEKFTDQNGNKYGVDCIFIGNPLCMFKIISYSKRRKNSILGLEILYANEGALIEARRIEKKINSAVPSIPVWTKNFIDEIPTMISKKINISDLE